MRSFIFALSLLPTLAFAQPVIVAPSSAFGCQLTPTLANGDEHYPGKGKVEKSNKLIQPAGKAVLAEGERFFFMGRIMDERCMPVQGAHIELWQTDGKGQYNLATKGQLMAPSAAFAGSGTAVTNNLGEFQFDTIFPGPYEDRAPHLHMRISHPDLIPLTTEVFFRNDRRNIADSRLMAMSPDLRDRLMIVVGAQEISHTSQGLKGYIELIMRGKEKFSQY